MTDHAYLAALDRALDAVAAILRRLGGLARLRSSAGTRSGFCADRRWLRPHRPAVAAVDLPTLVVQEGGYALDAIGPAVTAFLAALEAANLVEPPSAGGYD